MSATATADVGLGQRQAPMAAASTGDDTPGALVVGMGKHHTVLDMRDAV